MTGMPDRTKLSLDPNRFLSAPENAVKTVNMHEAKTHLSRLVERAAAGEEIVIARAGQPVARLVGLKTRARKRTLGAYSGMIRMSEDFDELPPDIQAAFEGDSG